MATESLLNMELADIIAAHLAQLDGYLVNADHTIRVPDQLLHLLLRLNRLTSAPPDFSSPSEQHEVTDLLRDLETFLRQMNVVLDDSFEETVVGSLWTQAQKWCTAVPRSRVGAAISDVWAMLKPAVPDCLEATTNERYIAKWWKPVPVMDVEIILRTEGLRVCGEPYEPDDLPGGIAVCFSLAED